MSLMAEIEESVPALRRYAWSLLRHREDADDLVQDCLVRALGHLPSGDIAVRPWLFTILHNLNVSRWRALRRRTRATPATVAEPASPPGQEGNLVMRDLLRGLERLPGEQRQVLLLVSVEGFEYREAAAILGVPVGTVMSRLSRARDGLRGHMGEHVGRRVEDPPRPALRRVK